MSNYHVLEVNEKEKRARVAFHIAIPSEDNSATPTPKDLQDALVEYLTRDGSTITSTVPWDVSTEETQMQAGSLYEHVEEVIFNAGNDSNAAKKAIIDAKYTALTTSVVDKMRKTLKFWGMNVDV